MKNIILSLKLYFITVAICVVFYGGANLIFGRTFFAHTAEGSLITDASGRIVGSEIIGQKFASPKYFKGRVSAVDYNASASGGSNLAPDGEKLKARAKLTIADFKPKSADAIPFDLVSASGSGLDPHITREGAMFQVDCVARARGVNPEKIAELVDMCAKKRGGFFSDLNLVNVLELNLLLDKLAK